ncbi:patatin-like phospholipase family protein [Draconibacterium sp. IB214405]|uniref:patatin-like phospholipase family protein n=1 Tax=Draconibacterium sp. IB214405 TaxID=3097352 RepID=UPI002A107887|nr:patatin-like phospholipase family protein [Draconibacterium sp. IB214405]MDX8338738.1 patatin-like phospholipase family protein [Draconibacterium sp. IB214405]
MDKEIALVLSGGGARGMAHIGVIEELEERGYKIRSVSGTSMGALVGGIYAAGKLKEFKEWAVSLDRHDMFRMVDFSFGGNGLIKGEKVLSKIREFVPDEQIEKLPIDYAATAVDLKHREEVVFTSGSLFDAIRASISIPTVFTPVEKNEQILVDGGVMNNLPISNVFRRNKDMLVAVHVNAAIPIPLQFVQKEDVVEKESAYRKWMNEFYDFLHIHHPKEKKERLGFLSLMEQSLSTGMLKQVDYSIEKGKPDVLINISRDACGTYDFYKAKELIEMGRYAAILELDKVKYNA